MYEFTSLYSLQLKKAKMCRKTIELFFAKTKKKEKKLRFEKVALQIYLVFVLFNLLYRERENFLSCGEWRRFYFKHHNYIYFISCAVFTQWLLVVLVAVKEVVAK